LRWTNKPFPTEGAKRKIKRFAWLPVDCGDETIWFETYYELQVFQTRTRGTKAGSFTFAAWDFDGFELKEKNT
jgi:hypothetical protein